MEIKDIATGLQHIGIPTNDIAETIASIDDSVKAKSADFVICQKESKPAKLFVIV